VIGLRGKRSRRPSDRIRHRWPRGRATSLATRRCLETVGRPNKRCAGVDRAHAAGAGTAARPYRRQITRRRRRRPKRLWWPQKRAEPRLGTEVAGARGSATSSAGRSYERPSVSGRVAEPARRRIQGPEHGPRMGICLRRVGPTDPSLAPRCVPGEPDRARAACRPARHRRGCGRSAKGLSAPNNAGLYVWPGISRGQISTAVRGQADIPLRT
jgi:hypothetical protein